MRIVWRYVVILSLLIGLNGFSQEYSLRDMAKASPARVKVQAEFKFEVDKNQVSGWVSLFHNNNRLAGWKVTLNQLTLSPQGGIPYYKLNPTRFAITAGATLLLTMIPPSNATPRFVTIKAKGKVGPRIAVLSPKNKSTVNLGSFGLRPFLITWNVKNKTEVDLGEVRSYNSMPGLWILNDYWVASGNSVKVPRKKLKPGKLYLIMLYHHAPELKASVQLGANSFMRIYMRNKSFFRTGLPLSLQRR